jgi:cation diffusion facilitator family transporter
MSINKQLLNKTASILSVITAIILIVIKFFAYIMTGSIMILSSLADSFLDLTTSLINFFAISYSSRKKDRYHKFGHDAVEDIAGLFQALLIGLSALFIMYKAIMNLIYERTIFCDSICLIVMFSSLILTLLLVSFQKYVIKKTKSIIIEVDSLHYTTDILMNIVFLISLVIINNNPELHFIDPLIALLVALYILKVSYGIGKKAFNNLMCREVNDKTKRKIIQIIHKHKNVKGYHDLKTRQMGNKIVIQCHIEIDKNLPFKKAHLITDELEADFHKEFKNCEILMHEDPV